MLTRRFAEAPDKVLDVDEHGRATRCTIQSPKSGGEIEALICRAVMDTAEIEPALDATDKPVAAPYVSRISFGIG